MYTLTARSILCFWNSLTNAFAFEELFTNMFSRLPRRPFVDKRIPVAYGHCSDSVSGAWLLNPDPAPRRLNYEHL